MRKLLLIGAGGHCQSVFESIEDGIYSEVYGIDLPDNIGKVIGGVKIIGSDDDLSQLYLDGFTDAFITLGTIGDSRRRRKLYEILKDIGYNIPLIVDKTSIISKSASISEGTYIGKGCIINAGVSLGCCCIVNTKTSVDHGSKVGDFVNLAPGGTISGDVSIGNDTHVGTGSIIIQGIQIGNNTMIGAGSVVVKDIQSNVVAYGVPCKQQKER